MIGCDSADNISSSSNVQGDWYLYSIVDLENNQGRFPKNAYGVEEETTVYQLNNLSLNEFKGKTFANVFEGKYYLSNQNISFKINKMTEVLDPLQSDAMFYLTFINDATSYQIVNNELKLYSSNYCLTFKPLQP